MASWALMNTSLYSGRAPSRSDISLAGFWPDSRTMCTGAPFLRAMAHTPAAAPMQSRSGYLWPMTNTLEASAISSPRALAMTRLFTLVRFSSSLVRPPKNSKLKRFFTTTWSPPRLRAISTERAAYWNSSPRLSASLPMPMDKVAWMPEGLATSRTVSRMENFPSWNWAKNRSSNTKR